jgi:hypothetical protein
MLPLTWLSTKGAAMCGGTHADRKNLDCWAKESFEIIAFETSRFGLKELIGEELWVHLHCPEKISKQTFEQFRFFDGNLRNVQHIGLFASSKIFWRPRPIAYLCGVEGVENHLQTFLFESPIVPRQLSPACS